MKTFAALLLCATALLADGPGRIRSLYSKSDFALTADPKDKNWRGVEPAIADHGPQSEPVPGHRTEFRSRWTDKNIYFLFTCPYENLHLTASPSTTTETNKLWDHDVAEVFIGADFDHIRHYRELQVSPQGEWVDLDIDRDNPKPEGGWQWNSGFEVKARLDEKSKVWYGEMRIPIKSIDTRPPKTDNEMRINFYRIQGPPPDRKFIAWQPTGNRSYHTPEAFGRIVLVKK